MKSLNLAIATVVCLTLLGSAPVATAAPAAAQGEVCRGGGPGYWLKNPWVKKFVIPKAFQNPEKTRRTRVRPTTKFDDVFRYRFRKDREGKILPRMTLLKALKSKGNPKKYLARQAVAALLNAGDPTNQFGNTKYWVIREFQVYWDGTDDMNKRKAQKHLKQILKDLNASACP